MKDPAVSVNRSVWSPDGNLLGESKAIKCYHLSFSSACSKYSMSTHVVPID
jgi:hypothetical protein